MGEKALGQILEEARKIADRSLPRDGDHLRKLADDTENMTASLAEMRANGQGTRSVSIHLTRIGKPALDSELCLNHFQPWSSCPGQEYWREVDRNRSDDCRCHRQVRLLELRG